ncbi:hypothetical protein [Bacillus solitudinis]|uniref:hypothetical protein n=1 Tax=Bacillus solitudinis TaxID=2014074 RepID=UPI000C240C6F|nr:hypothetical protein [Bacillus solitudinis]
MRWEDYSIQRQIRVKALERLLQTESKDILTLDYLLVISETEQEQYLLRQIVKSRKQQFDTLRNIYRYITSNQVQVEQEVFRKPVSYKKGLQSQREIVEQRRNSLSGLLQQVINPYVIQLLQETLHLNHYEGILLRQLERYAEKI